jgi:hypothetical protein
VGNTGLRMLKNVLSKQGKLNILIDSESFDKLLSQKNKLAERLLEYSETKMFDLLRSPFDTKGHKLRRIAEFRKEYGKNNNLTGLEITRKESRSLIGFFYRMRDIDSVAARVYKKESLTANEKESVLLVFIQASLRQSGVTSDSDILVTENNTIVENRLWFESHFPGSPLNIATIDEALQFMDLFAKFRDTYYIASNFTCNKGFWYLFSFKTKLYNYQLPWSSVVYGLPLRNGQEMLQGFSNRFTDLLRAIDEIGFQYYLGVNNDTLDTMVYHLNYFITLVTGIFDSLANLSVAYYDLKIKGVDFDKEKGMYKITLRKKVGRDFLKQLEVKNHELFNFISGNEHFIELFYPFRERILHRERLQQSGFEYYGSEGKWKANIIKIPLNVAEIIRQFDEEQEYEPVTKWGMYSVFLEPFHFVRAATEKLIEFCNKYFELLNFEELLEMHPEVNRKIEESSKSESHRTFAKELEIFKNNRLGF